MNKDIRISTSIMANKKIKRLIRRKGKEGFYNLISLWTWAGIHRPKGALYDMDQEDLMDAAATNDENFIELLVSLNLLNFDGNNYEINGWKDANGYAFHAEERSQKARKAAEIRWKIKDKNKEEKSQ